MNRLRALLRLLMGTGVLAWLWVRLELASRGRGVSLDETTRRAQRTARRVSRSVGLDVQVSGLPPAGTALLVANHRSYTDILALLACVECTFLAKVEMSRWPLFGALARRLQTVFVDRSCKDSRRAARRRLAELLERGHRVAVFPEGTTTRGPGCLPFQPGMFYTAAACGVPIVPVALHYEHPEDAWVDDDTLLRHFFERFARRSMRLRVVFGPTLAHPDGAALQYQAEAWIAEAVERSERSFRGWEVAKRRRGIRGRSKFLPGGAALPTGSSASGR